MVFKLLNRLEDPNNPLLGPNFLALTHGGLWQKNRVKSFFYNLVHFAAFLFVLSQFIELWYIKNNLEMALRNLSLTMLSTVCVVKACNLVFYQNVWKEIFEYVSKTEMSQLSKKDDMINDILFEYIKYARRVTYLYWCLVTATVFAVILAPFLVYCSSPTYRESVRNGTSPYPEIMSSWVPFDRTRGYGFWVATSTQALACFYGGIVVANFDTTSVVIMTFFSGQLKVLFMNCERLFGDGNELVTHDEAVKRVKECHLHHLNMMKFSSELKSLLSPVMFLYVIICSFMICANAVQLTTEGTSNMQRIWIAEYLMALIAQLLIFCWHSNDVLFLASSDESKWEVCCKSASMNELIAYSVESNQVDDAVYISAWWSQNVRIRCSLLLLGGQLRRSIMFKAGPFTMLNMATFLAGKLLTSFRNLDLYDCPFALSHRGDPRSCLLCIRRGFCPAIILKGSYSYYTLLATKED